MGKCYWNGTGSINEIRVSREKRDGHGAEEYSSSLHINVIVSHKSTQGLVLHSHLILSVLIRNVIRSNVLFLENYRFAEIFPFLHRLVAEY